MQHAEHTDKVFSIIGGSGGADLNYTDDDLDSYSTIWDREVTSSGKKDHKRVVEALKNISEGTDPEKYMDVDNILKYMAVHTFVVNDDSLSGTMAHNYYLYEYNGKLNILPWDYNLSFGGMSMGGGAGEGIGAPGGRGDGWQMRVPGGSVDEQQTGVPGGSVDEQQTGASSGNGDGQQTGASGGSGDEQQTGASGKEAGNSDGNEALQKTESGGV